MVVTEQTQGVGGERYTITEWTHPCAPGVPHPILGSPSLPPGKDVSQCQRLVKRKGIIYLKSYTNLRVIMTMSSLRSQSPLKYPQMHSPPFPLCPVQGTVSQKKIQKSVVLLCQSRVVPKRPRMAAAPGFKSQHQSSSATISNSSHNWPQLPAFHSFPALLGSHSKSGQVWPCGVEPIISKL